MSHLERKNNKIFSLEGLSAQVITWKKAREKVVFTNGCFDIIHRGHIELLANIVKMPDGVDPGDLPADRVKNLKEYLYD